MICQYKALRYIIYKSKQNMSEIKNDLYKMKKVTEIFYKNIILQTKASIYKKIIQIILEYYKKINN